MACMQIAEAAAQQTHEVTSAQLSLIIFKCGTYNIPQILCYSCECKHVSGAHILRVTVVAPLHI